MPRISQKASMFGESVIRDMTRLAQRHGAIKPVEGRPHNNGVRRAVVKR
jgi:hypothetical protein